MLKVVTGLIVTTLGVMALEHTLTFENTNYTLSRPLIETGERMAVNYNRFRVADTSQQGPWFMTAIADLENYLGRDYVRSEEYRFLSSQHTDTPFKTQTEGHSYSEGEFFAQLYRLYGGYMDERHRISLGLQKVSMGVGRIWNPTDLFNPKNPLALEPDEVFGVFALSYTYSPSQLSEVTAVCAQREDESTKYAFRAKGYLAFADFGLNVVTADDVWMAGYEAEGELSDGGIAVRSEGGWFEDKKLEANFFQVLIGVDYAFANALIIAAEWLHSSQTFNEDERLESALQDTLKASHDYVAISGSYEFDPLLYGSLIGVRSVDDHSSYIGPFLEYSLSDDASLGGGAMLYFGDSDSEFGDLGQTYYIKFTITF